MPADILQKGVIIHNGGDTIVDFPVRLVGFNFDLRSPAEDGSIVVRDFALQKPTAKWKASDWTVYGKGYKLQSVSGGESLRINRAADVQRSVSLFRKHLPVVAKENLKELGKEVTVRIRADKGGVNAVSLLYKDAKGETFQIKNNLRCAAGSAQTYTFDLSGLQSKNGMIIYGGNKDRTIDFPLKLLGFTVDFDKGGKNGAVEVYPPVYGTPTDNDLSKAAGGGGAIGID